MNQSTTKSERITAVLSTLAAVAILAAGVTAQQSHTVQDELVLLESDLRFQLKSAFRHDAGQQAERLALLEEVKRAWQSSPRSEKDRELFSDWLLEATIRSMPGSRERMPTVPEIGAREADNSTKKRVAPKPTEPVDPEVDSPAVTQSPTAPTAEVVREVYHEVSTAAPPEVIALGFSETTDNKKVISAPASENPIKINITVLAARIADYHRSLDRVETALLTNDTRALDFIGEQIHQLDEMTRDFHFVKLYYEALPNQQRQAVVAPRSMTATLAELERLLKRKESSSGSDFLGPFDTESQQRIKALRQQLAAVASRVR